MNDEEVDVFRRKWEVSCRLASGIRPGARTRFEGPMLTGQYYFSYCEAGFATKTLGDVIITVGREGAMELMEGIPL